MQNFDSVSYVNQGVLCQKKKCRPAMRARPPANGSATAGEAARGGGRLAHALPQAPGRRRRRAACKPSHLRRGPERRHGVGTHTDGGIGFSNFFFFCCLSVCLGQAPLWITPRVLCYQSMYPCASSNEQNPPCAAAAPPPSLLTHRILCK